MDANSPVLADVARRCRPLLALAGLLAVVLGLAWPTAPTRPASPVGFWVVSRRQLEQVNADVFHRDGVFGTWFPRLAPSRPRTIHGGPAPFRFDGDSVYLRMFRMHAWEEGSEDDIYRLPAGWKGSTLYYRDAAGYWHKVAAFIDGHFEIEQSDIRWVMEKADPGKLSDYRKPFLMKDRPVWHSSRLDEDRRPTRWALEWAAAGNGSRPVQPLRVLREDPDAAWQIRPRPVQTDELAFSPDGRQLIVAGFSRDPDSEKYLGHARIWDVTSGREEGCLEGLPDIILGVAFSPDGRQLTLASRDHLVRIWDVIARCESVTLAGHLDGVWAVTFSPDGKHLASADADGEVIVWDAATGQRVRSFHVRSGLWTRLAFTPDSTRLLASSGEEGVTTWNVATGAVESLLPLRDSFFEACFTPDGTPIAVVKGTIQVRDLTRGKPQGRFSRNQSNAATLPILTFSPDGRYIASGGDRDLILWDAATGHKVLAIRGYRGAVRGLAFSPDGRCLASSTSCETVELWDVAGLLASKPAAR
jgi:WD40 repeat protein